MNATRSSASFSPEDADWSVHSVHNSAQFFFFFFLDASAHSHAEHKGPQLQVELSE